VNKQFQAKTGSSYISRQLRYLDEIWFAD